MLPNFYLIDSQMDSWDGNINIPMDSTHFEIQMILEKTFEKIYHLITPGMKNGIEK